MQPTERIFVPNPLMTDAALFATLGANFAQYGETPLPQTTAVAAIQNGADETQTEILLATATALPTATASPQALELQATTTDGFAEPTAGLERRDREQAVPDITGPLLLGIGGLLLVTAIGTTMIRRRRSQ